MKILKYLFFLILLLIIGSAIYFGTKDGHYEIRDTITIEAPIKTVFEKVNYLPSWELWGPWELGHPDFILTTSELTKGEGASLSWKGNGKGTITNVKVLPYSEIEQDLVYNTKLGDRKATMHWEFEKEDDKTVITWTILGEHKLIDKVYHALFKSNFNNAWREKKMASLEALKLETEADLEVYSIHVDGVTHYSGGYYLYTTSVTKYHQLQKNMRPMMQELKRFVEENNIRTSGNPFVLIDQKDDQNKTTIFSVGIPVRDQVITPETSKVVSGFMPSVTAIKTTLKGHFKNNEEAYKEAYSYLQDSDYELNPDRKIFEIYPVDPDTEENPAQWITEIYLPIKSDLTIEEEESLDL